MGLWWEWRDFQQLRRLAVISMNGEAVVATPQIHKLQREYQ
jgi:hypothetical protein